MRAVVMREPGSVAIEEIDKPVPGQGEVLVRLVATGLCHTDKMIADGGFPAALPLVLGHEGAGIVEQVGPGVDGVVPGDHVVMSIVVSCGSCFQCDIGNRPICEVASAMAPGGLMLDGSTRLRHGDEELHSFLCQSSLAEYAVIPESAAVAVDKDIPLKVASVLACGAGTGYGAVVRRANVYPGASVVVVGCGGVGLTAVMAARAQGATTIIGVDPSADARKLAESVGATHTLDPSSSRILREVNALTRERGADFAFDVVGKPGTLELTVQCARPGGNVVAIGLGDASTECELDLYSLIVLQKRVTGTVGGSLSPRVDVPAALRLFADGRLPLDALITETVSLDDVPRLLAPENSLPTGRAVVSFES